MDYNYIVSDCTTKIDLKKINIIGTIVEIKLL